MFRAPRTVFLTERSLTFSSHGFQHKSTTFQFGTVAHEIGHAIGMDHEQSRRDRDKYIQINTQYVDPGYLDQYDVLPVSAAATPTTPYDYGKPEFYAKLLITITLTKRRATFPILLLISHQNV